LVAVPWLKPAACCLAGSLVVAKGAQDEATLRELLERGKQNSVRNLRIVEKEELRTMEPTIHPDATAALWSPDAGTVVPYEYAIALAENAVDNGVEIRIRREVVGIEAVKEGAAGGAGGAGGFVVTAQQWDTPTYVALQGSATRARLLGIACSGPAIALCALICRQTSLESLLAVAPQLSSLADAAGELGAVQAILVLLVLICCSALYLLMRLQLSRASSQSLPPVGTGGAPITVAQMTDGGSGSASALGGVTVATETIRCGAFPPFREAVKLNCDITLLF
jgi:hypothetical protein